MGDLLSARLRSQHHDLAQGAMYAPDEDPQWDATLEAADEIEALRARLTAAEERAEKAERELGTLRVAYSIANRTPDAFTLTAQREQERLRANAAERRVAALTEALRVARGWVVAHIVPPDAELVAAAKRRALALIDAALATQEAPDA